MKNFFLSIIIITLTVYTSFSQGILWENSIESAFSKAKKENKIVFIECFLKTCPVCQSFEPLLKNPKVGSFYNKNFINYKLNGEIAEQVKFLNKKNIWLASFPMLLFFDKNGNLIHQSDAGVPQVEPFVEIGKTALNPEKRSSNYKQRFEKGDRDLSFLIGYAYFARTLLDTTKNLEIADIVYEKYPKNSINSEESWAITKKIVMNMDNGFAKFWLNNIELARQFELKSGHSDGERNVLGQILQTSLYSKAGQNYSSNKIGEIKTYMANLGFSQFIEGATWQHETKALVRENKVQDAINIIQNIAKKNATNGAALTFLASFVLDNFNDSKLDELATQWLKDAKKLITENNYFAEYYYQLARLNKKKGDTINAKKNIQEAKKYAVLAKQPLDKIVLFEEILKK